MDSPPNIDITLVHIDGFRTSKIHSHTLLVIEIGKRRG